MIVYLYFRFQKNEFVMFERKFHKIFKYGRRRAIEHIPIVLSDESDKDEAETEGYQMGNVDYDEIVDELHHAEFEDEAVANEEQEIEQGFEEGQHQAPVFGEGEVGEYQWKQICSHAFARGNSCLVRNL
jgi:hypothetical protein